MDKINYFCHISGTGSPFSASSSPKIYRTVIEDVIKNVRDSFLNESVDEQVLQELKQLWENKLLQSRAIEFMPTDVNVRVSLTYPHNTQANRQGTSNSSNESQQQNNRIESSQHMLGQPGQLVYVSSHPTLGNVGAVSGAAAQAAMALQNNPRGQLLQQSQVLHVPSGHQVPQQVYQTFGQASRGVPSGTPARVIFTPAQLQQHAQVKNEVVSQLDGVDDSSSDDDLDDDDEDFDNIPIAQVGGIKEEDNQEEGTEDDPLNSEDDVSDEERSDLFDTDNVVVCQFDKIARTRNRWKFHLKDGIMNLNSKDYVFHKATGDSEW